MIRVSVIIPTMNRPSLLERCLAGLMRECAGAPEIEIIVVDDGSAAKAVMQNRVVCKRYTADFIEPEGHHGMAVTRNRGSTRARGEWLVFLDDDVAVDGGWYTALMAMLPGMVPDAVGFEGRVNPSGGGVWDGEVSNQQGGAYLTCHLGIRRSVFERLGGFDVAFEFKGPFCEDHELAARLLQWGKVPFAGSLSVTHAPRRVRLYKYVFSAARRCIELLRAEHYFFVKHPDRYHHFRAHRTFFGTLSSVLFRNVINDLRRRRLITLVAHPLQSAALVAGSLVEQIAAWLLLPGFVAGNHGAVSPFDRLVDCERTAACWGIATDNIDLLRVRRSLSATLLFAHRRRPVYDIRSVVRQVNRTTTNTPCGVYFRVDDVFFDDPDAVEHLCAVFRERSMPFLAAITGKDLCDTTRRPLVEMVRASGGCIGIHGFSHTGKFGPYQSELLQMSIPEILNQVIAIRDTGLFGEQQPLILVPPFNTVGPAQLAELSHHFAVITGGPETVRFTSRHVGPLALRGGGWYFPSLYPYYGCARSILENALLTPVSVPVCMSTHLIDEARDRFQALSRLLDKLPMGTRVWDGVF